jgi:hypothetical protein
MSMNTSAGQVQFLRNKLMYAYTLHGICEGKGKVLPRTGHESPDGGVEA